MLDTRGTLDAVERHWAVSAISPGDRTLARSAADAAWAGLVEEGPGSRRARLSKSQAGLVAQLATAYDRAAVERIDASAVDAGEGVRDRSNVEIEAAAAHAFTLYRALPITGDDEPARLVHALRVTAVGVVGGARQTLPRWLDLTLPSLPLEPRPTDTWDATLRMRLTAVWLDLLREGTPEAIERAFETLGRLREARGEQEALLLLSLPTAQAQQMRLHLEVLYALADAAIVLTLHGRRGPLPDVPVRLAHAFDHARAVTAGETALDGMLLWVREAAHRVAARRIAQLVLPGIPA